MARITEKELILPALYAINREKTKQLNTSDLIKKLEELLEVDEDDQRIISGRSDSYFSQKIRNLKSHDTLTKNNYTTYSKGTFTITSEGQKYLEDNAETLQLIINEEKFLNKNAIIIQDYFIEFNNSINNIKNLLEVSCISGNLQTHFYNMLYSSVITSLETYLADALKYNLSKNEKFLINFVKTFKDFKNIKCDFNDIFNLYGTINLKVEESLMSLLYHNLPKIEGIYKSTFNIYFQPINELMEFISIRHDLVHRNGKKKDGDIHNIAKDMVIDLCVRIDVFVKNIEDQFETLRKDSIEQ